MSPMVFIAMTRAEVERLRAAGTEGVAGGWVGYAATPEMLQAHQLGPKDVEDGEFTALVYAGLGAVTDPSADALRLVVAAEPSAGSTTVGADPSLGEIRVAQLLWTDLRALFVDERQAAEQVRSAREAVGGRNLHAALDLAVVRDLIEDHDLLWHLPGELDQIP